MPKRHATYRRQPDGTIDIADRLTVKHCTLALVESIALNEAVFYLTVIWGFMSNTGQFFELIGTQLKSGKNFKRPYDEVEDGGIDEDAMPLGVVNEHRWARSDDRYWQAADTCEKLDPGFYKLNSMPNVGPCLTRANIATDGLVEIPDAAGKEVLEEFSTFWQLKQQFAERGFLHKRGILLWGPPGCLDCDTMIHYQAFNDGRRSHKKDVTIERLYQLFHGITGAGKGRYQTLSEGTEIRVSSVDDEGRIFSNVVRNVVKSGIKPVFRLRTVNGLEILATKDHKFLSNGHYVPLESLAIGDDVDVHVNTPVNIGDTGRQKGRRFCYVKHHPIARTKMVGDYTYKVLPNARVVVEAAMNGLSQDSYLSRLNDGLIEGLDFLPANHDVHHVDEDCTNDNLDNLRVMTHREHAQLHGADQSLFFVATSDQIASIEFVEERETYDIQMDGPYHNFVANNFIVHNSGKTATLMLMARDIVAKHGGIVCQVDHPGVAGMCLSMIRKIEPDRQIVALIEDLDAQVERYGEDGFLSLLDGETQVDRIVYIATTNYPERLDRRFVDRPSRFDTIRWIGMPSRAARRTYLLAKDPSITDTELAHWVDETEGFSIAHLRELVILVRCFGRPLESAIQRLDKMRMRRPSSADAPDKIPVGFGSNGTADD